MALGLLLVEKQPVVKKGSQCSCQRTRSLGCNLVPFSHSSVHALKPTGTPTQYNAINAAQLLLQMRLLLQLHLLLRLRLLLRPPLLLLLLSGIVAICFSLGAGTRAGCGLLDSPAGTASLHWDAPWRHEAQRLSNALPCCTATST